MTWPVIINGHTYTEDMFIEWGYRTALPNLCNDVGATAQNIQNVYGNVMTARNDVNTMAYSVAQNKSEVEAMVATVTNTMDTMATSASTISFGLGQKTFAIQPNKSLLPGMRMVVALTSNPEWYIYGPIISYNPATGEITLESTHTFGIGEGSDWKLSVSGIAGQNGSISELSATSNSTISISVGIKNINVGLLKHYSPGMPILVTLNGDTNKYLQGIVQSYDTSTGALVFDATIIQGSGNYNFWNVSLSGVSPSVDANGESTYINMTGDITLSNTATKIITIAANTYNSCINLPADIINFTGGPRWIIRNDGPRSIFIKHNDIRIGKINTNTIVSIITEKTNSYYKYRILYSDGVDRSIMIEEFNPSQASVITVPIGFYQGDPADHKLQVCKTQNDNILAVMVSDSGVFSCRVNNDNSITYGSYYPITTAKSWLHSAPDSDGIGSVAMTGEYDIATSIVTILSINKSTLSIDIGSAATASISGELVNQIYFGYKPDAGIMKKVFVGIGSNYTQSAPVNQNSIMLSGLISGATFVGGPFDINYKSKYNVLIPYNWHNADFTIDPTICDAYVVGSYNNSEEVTVFPVRIGQNISTSVINKSSGAPILSFFPGAPDKIIYGFLDSESILKMHVFYAPSTSQSATIGNNKLYKFIITYDNVSGKISEMSNKIVIEGPSNWSQYLWHMNLKSYTTDKYLLLPDADMSKLSLVEKYSPYNQSNLSWDYMPNGISQSAVCVLDNTKFVIFFIRPITTVSTNQSATVGYVMGYIAP